MGSGGPRGLQILLLVADRGRGGFDSHTFPPAFLSRLGFVFAVGLLLVLADGAERPAHAQDPVAAPAETTATPATRATPATPAVTRAPTPAPTTGERPRPWLKKPTAIMLRSLVVPGWGQLENGRPWKAALAVGLEVTAGVRLVDAWKATDEALEREQEAIAAGDDAAAAQARADYDNAYNRRAEAGWILAAVVLVSMVDAYVDAHLLQFDADFGPDPGLPPDGPDAAAPAKLKLGLRLDFTGP